MVDIISVTTLIVAVITTIGVTAHKIGCRRLNLCCIDSDCRKPGNNTPDNISPDDTEMEPEPKPKHELKLEPKLEIKTPIPSPRLNRKIININESVI